MTDKSFAELLDHLFRTVHPKGRGSYTYEQVSQGIRETSGLKISASAIQQLRTGVNKNPKRDTIRALAGFFGVEPSYFFDEGKPSASAPRFSFSPRCATRTCAGSPCAPTGSVRRAWTC
ncbi:helix-turn-helix domain-containing protein [Streptomyces sp. C8S0]|uniref:helix-turn-helix domain-containing protein n=1 Tax=Streptomyces sp. C8S0 TaxID=2585716 RepID=UPI00299F80E8|nr:helix-turn-helix domain-containing protein [Streptomyces sp. C8S0]